MQELNMTEIKQVSGGWGAVVVVVAASFIGGYINGRMNKAKKEKEHQEKLVDYCKNNPCQQA